MSFSLLSACAVSERLNDNGDARPIVKERVSEGRRQNNNNKKGKAEDLMSEMESMRGQISRSAPRAEVWNVTAPAEPRKRRPGPRVAACPCGTPGAPARDFLHR